MVVFAGALRSWGRRVSRGFHSETVKRIGSPFRKYSRVRFFTYALS